MVVDFGAGKHILTNRSTYSHSCPSNRHTMHPSSSPVVSFTHSFLVSPLLGRNKHNRQTFFPERPQRVRYEQPLSMRDVGG
jgi:hypothetical protein